MSRAKRSVVATEEAVRHSSVTNSSVIAYLCQENFVVYDEEQRSVKANSTPFYTHLSLDGAGRGIFHIPWKSNKKFLEQFYLAQCSFLASQQLGNRYSICPPPSIAEIISNCAFIRPVFDLDLWDEGEMSLQSAEYAALRARICFQIITLFDIFKRIMPDHVVEHPDFSADRSAWPMDASIEWKKLDMVVLESPCKQVTKSVNGAQRTGIKHSFHLRFPFIRISSRHFLQIIPYMVHWLEKSCPRSADTNGEPLATLANSWFDGLDHKIIHSGIKLPGSQKAQNCSACFDILNREHDEEQVSKARRQVSNQATVQLLKSAQKARTTEDDSRPRRTPAQAPFHDENESILRINEQFILLQSAQDVQRMLDLIQSVPSLSKRSGVQYKFGPSKCGNPKCVNKKIYDGRFHQPVAILDAETTANQFAMTDIYEMSDKAKLASFTSHPVRMLFFLQARTPFESSNVTLNTSINFDDYFSLFYDKGQKVRALTGTKRTKDQADDAGATATSSQPNIADPASLTPHELYIRTMSQAQITSAQETVALKLARQYNPNYARLEYATMSWKESRLVFRPLNTNAGRFCLNKNDCHTSNVIYFVFQLNHRNQPILYPGCYSEKQESRQAHNQNCKDFYRSRRDQLARVIPIEDARVLFGPFYRELDKLQAAGSDVASPQPAAPARDEVVDMILSTEGRKQKRAQSKPRCLVSSKEYQSLDRAARQVESNVVMSRIAPMISTFDRDGEFDRVATPVNAIPRPLSTPSVADMGDLESFMRSQMPLDE